MRKEMLVFISLAIFSTSNAFAQQGVPDGMPSETFAQAQHEAALKRTVQNALRDAGIRHVRVRVRGETVLLYGQLPSKEQVDLAVSKATSVSGVASVRSHLKTSQ